MAFNLITRLLCWIKTTKCLPQLSQKRCHKCQRQLKNHFIISKSFNNYLIKFYKIILIWNDRYLKEFRCEQCPLFLQHKCTNHKPFTCFYWHFMNQRRRRPIRKRDGTFNYSPDVYCTKYDETTGLCSDGDE